MPYQENLKKFEAEYNDLEEIERIKSIFSEKKIKVVKYNQCLDKETSSECFFNGYFQLDDDGQYLEITLKKPIIRQAVIYDVDHEQIRKR